MKKIKYIITETNDNFEEHISIIKKFNELEEAEKEYELAINDYPEVYLHRVEQTLIPEYFNVEIEVEKLIDSLIDSAECNSGLLDKSKKLIEKTFSELKEKLIGTEKENYLYYHIETIRTKNKL